MALVALLRRLVAAGCCFFSLFFLFPSSVLLLLLFLFPLSDFDFAFVRDSPGDFDFAFFCDSFAIAPPVNYIPAVDSDRPVRPRTGVRLLAAPAWVPSGPTSRAGFPLRPRHLGGSWGLCGSRLTVPRHNLARAPLPRVAGVIVPAAGCFRVPGACAVLIPAAPGGGTGPGASRLRRTPSAVRGGAIGRLRWMDPAIEASCGGQCGPFLPSASEVRGISFVVPPCAVTLRLPSLISTGCRRAVDPW